MRRWINRRRPRATRRQRQRCRKRNGNCLQVSQESAQRAALRLPLVGLEEVAALRRSKTKTSYEGKPNATGGRKPPPVGRPRSDNRVSVLKYHRQPWRKAIAIGGVRGRLPAGRPRSNTRVSALKYKIHATEAKTNAIGDADCLPLVGPGDQNSIRKETLAAGSLRSRLQAHSSMRKCCRPDTRRGSMAEGESA